METAAYTIWAILDCDPWSLEVCSFMQRDGRFLLRQLPQATLKSPPDCRAEGINAVLIFADSISPSAKNWIRVTVNQGVPMLLVTDNAAEGRAVCPEDKRFYVCQRGDAASVAREAGLKLRMAVLGSGAQTRQTPSPEPTPDTGSYAQPGKLIVIGASMGGTEAVSKIVSALPTRMPPIVVVQHMPPKFTQMYAKSLDGQCALTVVHASDGDAVEPGRVYIAPGGMQLRVKRSGESYRLQTQGEERVTGHCPSVDVLFSSTAKAAKDRAVGVILTGMGGDGAQGLLELRRAGSFTIGQDAATSLVYGMPKMAFEAGAVCLQSPLEQIPSLLVEYARK